MDITIGVIAIKISIVSFWVERHGIKFFPFQTNGWPISTRKGGVETMKKLILAAKEEAGSGLEQGHFPSILSFGLALSTFKA